MGEGGGGRRVGQVVGRNVNRLHRGDRTLGGGGDALLQRAHVGGERRLIAHRRRNAPEQRRHFRARLGEAEDVVDEEQHVLAFVAEIFRHREAGEADAGARARRLVHLAEHQRAFGALGGAGFWVLVHAGLDHLVIEIVALARALAHAGEHRIAAVRFGDVVDQLLNEHGLADAGAAEQADLAALGVRREQVHDLDAGDENLGFGRLLGIGRRIGMDRAAVDPCHRAGFVHRLADDIDDAAEQAGTDRHRRSAGRCRRLPGRAPGLRWSPWRWCARSNSPRCWATSSTRRLPWLSVSSAFRIAGSSPSNCTSTTAPITWAMRPVLLAWAGVAMDVLVTKI